VIWTVKKRFGVLFGTLMVTLGLCAGLVSTQQDRTLTLIVLAGTLIVTFVVMVWSARAIMKSIGAEPREAVLVAERIARGDLGSEIGVERGDATSLMAAMSRMQQQLRNMVSNIRSTSGSIQVASAEISAGNHNLSQRTEQQASALEQTSASMQQMTATVGRTRRIRRRPTISRCRLPAWPPRAARWCARPWAR
jgi:methyl-accepting chemotaxis protein